MKKPLISGYWFDQTSQLASQPWWTEIMELTFNRARIIITDGKCVENGW